MSTSTLLDNFYAAVKAADAPSLAQCVGYGAPGINGLRASPTNGFLEFVASIGAELADVCAMPAS